MLQFISLSDLRNELVGSTANRTPFYHCNLFTNYTFHLFTNMLEISFTYALSIQFLNSKKLINAISINLVKVCLFLPGMVCILLLFLTDLTQFFILSHLPYSFIEHITHDLICHSHHINHRVVTVRMHVTKSTHFFFVKTLFSLLLLIMILALNFKSHYKLQEIISVATQQKILKWSGTQHGNCVCVTAVLKHRTEKNFVVQYQAKGQIH